MDWYKVTRSNDDAIESDLWACFRCEWAYKVHYLTRKTAYDRKSLPMTRKEFLEKLNEWNSRNPRVWQYYEA